MSKQAFFFAILTALVWGVVPTLEKLGLARVQPNVGLLIRSTGVIFGAGLLLLFKFNSIKSEFLDVTPRAIVHTIFNSTLKYEARMTCCGLELLQLLWRFYISACYTTITNEAKSFFQKSTDFTSYTAWGWHLNSFSIS